MTDSDVFVETTANDRATFRRDPLRSAESPENGNPISGYIAIPPAVVYPTRRELRLSEAGTRTAPPARPQGRTAPPRRPTAPAVTAPRAPRSRSKTRTVFSALVMVFAAALVATIALPSYAFVPSAASAANRPGGARGAAVGATQKMHVGSTVTAVHSSRDGFSATTPAALQRQTYAQIYAEYTGPSASDYIKNPAHPAFSLQAVYETARKYMGVPYIFGGADPSGFDCSGFVMFVYAQFGVSLQHSVHMQNQEGIQISAADAQPGDVVVFNDLSHDGFYAGDGKILHAPYSGASVREQPLWTNAVHFVRFGVKG